MRCPRCHDSVLDERVRDGVTVDSCPQCRGVWLDRGELEKLIARSRDDYEEGYKEYDKYRDRPRGERYPEHKRRKSWIESLFD